MIDSEGFNQTDGETARDRSTPPRSIHHGSPSFRPASRALDGPVPPHFEAFYRAKLRFVPGARLKTTEVRDAYNRWATDELRPIMGFRELNE